MGAILLVIIQVVRPMRLDHFLAMVPQYVSMYLLFCMLTNLLSIYVPIHVAGGLSATGKPRHQDRPPSARDDLPVSPGRVAAFDPSLGTELVLTGCWARSWDPDLPVFTLLLCALVVGHLPLCAHWQGGLLSAASRRFWKR